MQHLTLFPTMELLATRPAKVGKVFFVNGSTGDDTKNGRDPNAPLLTLKQALSLCTDDENDYIYVLDYPWAGGVSGEDEPIVVNKRGVTILAGGSGAYNVPVIGASGDTAAISITANKVRFIGLEFVTGAGSSHGCVEINASCFGVEFWDCLFERDIHGPGSGAQDGILVAPTFDAVDLKVIGCIFGPGLSRDGIRVVTNSTRGLIGLPGRLGNFFDRCPGIGLNLGVSAGTHDMGIFDNRFLCHSDAVGKAITFVHPDCANAFVDGNSANYGQSAMGSNPYRDLGSNHWGLNYRAGISIMPVTV